MFLSRTALLGGVIFAAASVAACGGGNQSATGTGGTGGSGTTTGTATTTTTTGAGGDPLSVDPPQVANFGGTVLTSPKIQIIYYEVDPFANDVNAAVKELAATPTWAEQSSEYGVGPLTVLPPISIAGTPPATLDDTSGNVTPFEQTLVDNTSGANPVWGAADPSTIYMFLAPLGTDIQSSGDCCTGYLGYHWEAPTGSGSLPYAVLCHCAAQKGDPLTPLQYVTTTINHEAVEASTDPFPSSNPAYAANDDRHLAWTVATGGEVADMCEYNADSNVIPKGAKYMVQRSWSNAAAKAGKNPCLPVPETGPYFNAVPVLTDMVSINALGTPSQTEGVIIPVGTSKTIDVKMEAQGPTSGPWKVTAYDLNDYLGSGSPFLKLSLDKSTGSDGDVLHLTITSLKADQQDVSAVFVLQSDLGMEENLSMGAVGQ
jgi:hypothetical protein